MNRLAKGYKTRKMWIISTAAMGVASTTGTLMASASADEINPSKSVRAVTQASASNSKRVTIQSQPDGQAPTYEQHEA